MNGLSDKEVIEAKEKLSGLKIWCIIAIVLLVYFIIAASLSIIFLPVFVGMVARSNQAILIISAVIISIILVLVMIGMLILYVISLIGLNKRKRYGYYTGTAALIITICWFPIGTIIGSIFLARLNKKLVKRYLKYGS